MLLKASGCIFIIVAATAIGMSYVNMLRKRISGLSQMIELLTMIKIKLEYELCSIPEILKQIKSNETGKYEDFLENCILEIDGGTPLKSAWNKGVFEFSEEMYLLKSDISLLTDFSNALGDTDISGQISNLEMYIEMLNKNLAGAEKELKEKSRVSISCSIFAGILVSILLI